MAKRHFLLLTLVSVFALIPGFSIRAQENPPNIHVIVDMVQLNVAVTDDKGKYITGLRPEDFAISEDGISQKIATFAEGDEPTRNVAELASNSSNAAPMPNAVADDPASGPASALNSLVAGSNVFILFDTSNYMYRGFVFAQDAISDFVRSLDSANKIAFYSYSRDLSRASALTRDRSQLLRG